MIGQNILNHVFANNLKSIFKSKDASQSEYHGLESIRRFLLRKDFNGFTSEDLFIMQFIKKGWGQDIAALSNMAEALVNLSIKSPNDSQYHDLIEEVVKRALHPKVSPYKKDIENISSLGKFGYYLEHLNIILGCYQRIAGERYVELNERISRHLLAASTPEKSPSGIPPFASVKPYFTASSAVWTTFPLIRA